MDAMKANEDLSEENIMHAETTYSFDEDSGRTVANNAPWREALHKRKARKQGLTNAEIPATRTTAIYPTTSLRTSPNPQRRPLPPLPDDQYKVIYRPKPGMKLSTFREEEITASLAQACRMNVPDFCKKVITQTQWHQNLIVTSTDSEDLTIALSEITQLTIGNQTHEVTPYIKPLPGTVRGVIHGLTPGTPSHRLMELLAANDQCEILHARMLGKSSSAVLTFQGPHVPFYVRLASAYTRCKPYLRTVQYCKTCGAFGHRKDICPNPENNSCTRCGAANITEEHTCPIKCKLCELPHETASKDCKGKLRPNPKNKRTPPPPPPPANQLHASRPPASTNPPANQPNTPRGRSQSRNRNNGSPVQTSNHVSWADKIKNTTKALSSPQQSKYAESIEALRQQNASLQQQLDDQRRQAQAQQEEYHRQKESLEKQLREQAQQAQARQRELERKLDMLLGQIQPRSQVSTAETTDPQLIALEQRLATTLENMFQTSMETIINRAAAMIDTVNTNLTQQLEKAFQRITALEKDNTKERKKPKYPHREVEMDETLNDQDDAV